MVIRSTIPFTRADYEALPEGFPAQLVDGQLVKDAAPVPWHQWVLATLYEAFRDHVGRPRVLFSPVDLPIDDYNVFQPDLVVFEEGFRMTPDLREIPVPLLVVEVLSGSTAKYDRGAKCAHYLEKGVREVWLVHIHARTIEVRTPDAGFTARDGETARSTALPGFELAVTELLTR